MPHLIIHKFYWCCYILTLAFSTALTPLHAQKQNKYGLRVVEKQRDYRQFSASHPNGEMVNLLAELPSVRIDLRYNTPQNFTGKKLYKQANTTYARVKLANILKLALDDFSKQGYGILVWDAYRPYSATEKMWKIVPDDRYAANPKTGSMHNRGAAIDLTLFDLQTGKELNMGTGFDHFTDTAHIDFKSLPDEVLKNRKLLADVLTGHGLVQLKTEWWHFYLPDARDYPLMNFSFKKMKNLVSL